MDLDAAGRDRRARARRAGRPRLLRARPGAARRLGEVLPRRPGPHPDRGGRSPSTTAPATSPRWSSPSTPPPAPGTRRCPARRSPTQAAEHADVLIPFGSVDPHAGQGRRRPGAAAGDRARGARVQVPPQPAGASSRTTSRYYPLYEALQELGVPALFHTGQTGIGAGLPGGRGIKLRYSAPMLLDDVAADFPHLTIVHGAPVGAVAGRGDLHRHPQGERLHRPVRLVAEVLPAAARPRRQRRCSSARCCSAPTSRSSRPTAGSPTSTQLDIKDEVRPLILKDNAVRMLGLG